MKLGSLTQGIDLPYRCAQCQGRHGTRLEMVLTDGTPAVFTSCHACGANQWTAYDENLTAGDLRKALAPTG